MSKKDKKQIEFECDEGKTKGETLARVVMSPGVRHAALTSGLASGLFGGRMKPDLQDATSFMTDEIVKAKDGDKALASQLLAAQAMTLDALFTELARRAGNNMGEYLEATKSYTQLALKAQANCRATLEALTKLHKAPEQVVKHVHVNEGGKAVVADQIHQHQGEGQNGETGKQSHATGATGECPALLGQDPQEDGVPISGCERQETVPDARRDQSRRPKGKS